MGDKATGEEDIRKLQKTGSGQASYMVTIPKEYIKELGWKEHQKVVVKREGKKLSITDWKD